MIVPNGDPPVDTFPDTYNEYHPSGVPGGRAPHIWLDERRKFGSSLFDQFGRGFTLLRIAPSTADSTLLEEVADSRGIPFDVLDVEAPEARKLYGTLLALIRPDQYIAWRGDVIPDDCDALWSQVCGF